MKYRHLLSIICFLFLGAMFAFGQKNTLSIPDVSVAKGKTISLPVNLDNTADVVAVQFTLTVPEGLTINASSATLSERSDDHSVTLRNIGSNKYMAMVFSSKNKALKGRTGKFLTVPLTASTALEEGTEHQLTLSDVVIGARDGSNLATGFNAGKVTISKSPDLEVSQVAVKETTLGPGGKITLNWSVANIGGLPTTAGWSEYVYLKDANGTTKLLGTLYHDEILNAEGIISRNAELNIPTVIGLDGNCSVVVKLIPNSNAGEPSWLQGNNVEETSNTLMVNKSLFLSPENSKVEESSANNVRFQLSRSGDVSKDEVFTITSDEDNRIGFPQSVTIIKGQSSVYFYAQVSANKVLDNDSIVRFTISGDTYPEISSTIDIEDDTYPSLNISTDVQDVTEGGSIDFVVSTQRASQSDIEVKMTCDFAKHFKIPSSIIIPAGQTNVKVAVDALEDDIPNVEEVVTFTVSAAKHNPASLNTVLVDNDVPTLQLDIMPVAISESAGPLSIAAKLRRTDNIDKVVTVKLSDDSDGGIYYGRQTITLEKGVEETTINLGPIDNAIVDGERTYNISAAVWIASCSCNANNGTSGGVVTVPLTVYDNDGPTLTMTSKASMLKEGDEMTITIKRNTDTANPLVVNIESDHDSDLEYPSTVTIPSGETSASFTVISRGNEITDDGFTTILNAKAEGFATGNIWFAVSDQTLPDAQIISLSANNNECIVGDDIVFRATIMNTGNIELPANTLVQLIKSSSRSVVAEMYTPTVIPVGETQNVIFSIKSPSSVGEQCYFAKVNTNKRIAELDYNNNSSVIAKTMIIPPFSTETNVSKKILVKNEEVEISGRVSGRNIANADVDVYVINRGYRHVISTKTDSIGHFCVKYSPFENQSGHFVVGSCYRGDNKDVEHCSFDIYSIDVKNETATLDVLKGENRSGKFVLKNNGVLPLTNVKAKLVSEFSDAEVTFEEKTEDIAGGESVEIAYSVKGIEVSPELAWQTVKMEFTCDEGAIATSNINYYIREPKAKLKVDVACINTTVTIGSSRDYHIVLTNTGKAETGNISFSTPSWCHLDGVQKVSSLSTGESVEVALVIGTDENMEANVPVTGTIGVNCDNGDGISIAYNIEPVSSFMGELSVDVCDEYTYYTSEGPHVSGASVVIKHPTTGAVIATGVTNEYGMFNIELPEGYYAVSVDADYHKGITKNIYVDPERNKKVTVNIGYSAITFNWDVEETQVEDEYKIVTKVSYETNVPVPVVILDVPEKIDGDNMRIGESTLINITATNKGLVTALNNTIILPENTDEWMFEPLINLEPFDLPSQQTVVVPVRITRLRDNSVNNVKARSVANDMMNNFSNCMVHVKDTYEALCGDELKNNESIERMAMKMCGMAATSATIFQYMSNYFGVAGGGGALGTPIGGGNSTSTSSTNITHISEQSFNMCDTCDAKKAEDLLEVLIDKTFLSSINAGMNEAYDIAKNKRGQEQERRVVTQAGFDALINSLIEAAKAYAEHRTGLNVSDLWDLGENIMDYIKVTRISSRECPENDIEQKSKQRTKNSKLNNRGWQQEYNQVASMEADYLENYYNILVELFGDVSWLGTDFQNKLTFASSLVGSEYVTENEIISACPSSLTKEQAIALYKRINGLEENNSIDFEKIEKLVDRNVAMNEDAISYGFESLADRFAKVYDVCVEKFKEQESSVCASISLQFSQKMVMTRQAFRGTLTVFNGHDNTAMTDVKLSLTVRDNVGNVATSHEFQINPETLNGFEGELSLDGGWTLEPQQKGIATVLFIPTKYAAPTVEKLYSFGGTLSYVDPFTGLTVTRDLAPVTLSVKPSPNLDLTYFMQRDIKGDDPLTEQVEPSEEAEFSLLINNVGYGDATDVKMFTEQPKIIDNEKGLLIDFELLSSQLNGGDKTLALGGTVATDFGTIPAKSTSYAQWWIKSSLLGHFTDYNVEATHVTSYGNPDLSLLNDVTIHELIRSLDVDGTDNRLVGFMVNDIADAEDMPDMLYLSNGEIEKVSMVNKAEIQKVSDTEYTLTTSVGNSGWNYGSVTDPTYGVSALKSVVRQSDGKEMSLRNFWQTDRTIRDGKDPLYENRIHFADNITAGDAETYVLTFEPTPEIVLDIASVEGVPEGNGHVSEPLNNIKIMFNKYIDPATFTTDDISLSVQGTKQDVSSVVISTDDNKSFNLDFSAVNENVGNGYFVFTVNAADIKDADGFFGKEGKQVGWVMFRDGLVSYSASANPISAGTIHNVINTSESQESVILNNIDYASTLKLTTAPNDGYEFKNWTINGDVVSTDTILEYTALADMTIKANYMLKSYPINICEEQEGGSVVGSASGVYSYGEVLKVSAIANEDFVFDGWTVNGSYLAEGTDLSLAVDGAKEITPIFRRDIFKQSLAVSRGWNWISSYVKDPIPVSNFFGSITHVVGQFDEVVNDPVYGMTGGIETLLPGHAYKMESSYNAMKSFKGHLHDISESPIELHAGYNWISYPNYEERSINDVLANAAEGDYLTSQYGFCEFSNGNWEGTLNVLTPGYGYIYKSSTSKNLIFDFTYPDVTEDNSARARNSIENHEVLAVDIHKYPSTMNVIARISDVPYEMDNDQCRIYAFVGNECRGESRYVGGKHYLTIYGDNTANVSLVVENINNGNTYIAKDNLTFVPEVVGSRKAPYVITLSDATNINGLQDDSSRKMKIYSVEGVLLDSKTTHETLKKLSRGLYIIDGQKFMVK